jgi:hypothetical protein
LEEFQHLLSEPKNFTTSTTARSVDSLIPWAQPVKSTTYRYIPQKKDGSACLWNAMLWYNLPQFKFFCLTSPVSSETGWPMAVLRR